MRCLREGPNFRFLDLLKWKSVVPSASSSFSSRLLVVVVVVVVFVAVRVPIRYIHGLLDEGRHIVRLADNAKEVVLEVPNNLLHFLVC
jgi:hypothetical protein